MPNFCQAVSHNPVFRDLEQAISSSDLVVQHYEHLRFGRPQPEAMAFQTLVDLLEVDAGIKTPSKSSSRTTGSISPTPIQSTAKQSDTPLRLPVVPLSPNAPVETVQSPVIAVDSTPSSTPRWWIVAGLGACTVLLYKLRRDVRKSS